MFAYPSEVFDALQDPATSEFWLVWITARNRETGDPEPGGFSTGPMAESVTVIDPTTGASVARTYIGLGSLISVGDIPGTSDLSPKEVTVSLNTTDDTVLQHIRGYDMRRAPIEIHLGLFTPGTQTLVAVPQARFVGFVDKGPIPTPADGNVDSIKLKCVSHSAELTRFSTDVRSNQSQQLRSATDTFMKYVDVMGQIKHSWGKFDGAVK